MRHPHHKRIARSLKHVWRKFKNALATLMLAVATEVLVSIWRIFKKVLTAILVFCAIEAFAYILNNFISTEKSKIAPEIQSGQCDDSLWGCNHTFNNRTNLQEMKKFQKSHKVYIASQPARHEYQGAKLLNSPPVAAAKTTGELLKKSTLAPDLISAIQAHDSLDKPCIPSSPKPQTSTVTGVTQIQDTPVPALSVNVDPGDPGKTCPR
jgi:hypothetical protein